MKARTPIELIELYWYQLYNDRDYELVRDLCADPIVRHDPGGVTMLGIEEQKSRIQRSCSMMEPFFTHEVLFADQDYVCSVWNMHTRKGESIETSGIEVFKVEDGRFTDCWNSAYSMALWPKIEEAGATSGSSGDRIDAGVANSAARTVVEAFFEARNRRDREALIAALADTVVQSAAGDTRSLSRDALIAEILSQDPLDSRFSQEVLLTGGDHVCSIWNRTSGDRTDASCVEIYRVRDGRITHRWITPETKGAWGKRGDPAVPANLPPPALLSSIDEIDHNWMQAVFQHAGVDMPRLALVKTKPIGNGTASSTVQAILGHNQEVTGLPETVVCKFHSAAEGGDAMIGAMQPYRREAEAYKFFGKSPSAQTPRAYWTNVSPDGLRVNIVLEDLSAFCRAGDQLTGCSQVEAAAVVKQLALLHRAYWGRPDLMELPWTASAIGIRDGAAGLYASGLKIFRDRYGPLMTAEELDIMEAFAPVVQRWAATKPEYFALIHSDPRVDNVMFADGGESGVSAYLFDWQIVDVGDPQYDVAYFLSGSLSPEDRRACERGLIAFHAAQIAEVDPSYTVSKAEEGYRRNIGSGLYTTVMAANGVADSDHNRLLLVALARRNCAAVRDWDGVKYWTEYSA